VDPAGEFRFLSVSHDFLACNWLDPRTGSRPSGARHHSAAIARDGVEQLSGGYSNWSAGAMGGESTYPDGRRFGEVAVTPLYDDSGIATHLVGVVLDISERKRMEEERAEAIVESSDAAIVSESLEWCYRRLELRC
jgi:hypothetical protein